MTTMANNTEDDTSLDNSINQEAENPSDEILSTDNQKVNAINQETENMEVHHHSHEHHGKRTWKSYFNDFFMLFLAVFCGSLAEYQLEHKIEADREIVYVKAIVSDLKRDSLTINWALKEIPRFNKKVLELGKLFSKNDLTQEETLNLVLDNQDVKGGYRTTTFNNNAITQLKNSGGLRLIRNDSCRASIEKYYSYLVEVERVISRIQSNSSTVNMFSGKMFNYIPLYQAVNEGTTPEQVKAAASQYINAIFYNQDRKLMNEYANLLDLHVGSENYLLTLIEDQKYYLEQVLNDIQKFYEIK
jgi:hypothetical protein